MEAIATVHRANYIHRDIKAENIMFDENGSIRLIDFQMVTSIPEGDNLYYGGQLNNFLRASFLVGCSQVKSDYLFGTASYLAPESIDNKVYSKASDIWQVISYS
jgi:hypothetical protein